MAVRTWTLKIRGDEGDALRAADKVERRYKNLDINKGLSSKMDRLRAKFSSTADSLASTGRRIAKGIAIGVAGGVAALAVLGNKAINMASDLRESVNAVKVVFGPAVDKIRDFGKTSAESFGLSQRAFNQLATPLGAMLRNAGLGADQAALSTINLTKRAADMASVFNTDVSDAMTAIQAALRGEADPIERFGVNMSAVAVQAEALAMGINKSWNEMKPQERAAARLSLFFKQTERVAGDFANTSGEMANQQRIAAARAEELAAKIGMVLLPVKAKAIELATIFMDKVGMLGNAFRSAFSGEGVTSDGLVGFVERAGVVAREAWPHLRRFGRSVQDWASRIGDFFKRNPKVLFATLAGVIGTLLVGAVVALGAALIAVISPFVLVVAAVGAIAGAVTYAYTRWEFFREGVDSVVAWFKSSAWPAIQRFATSVREIFAQVVEWVRRNWPKVQEAVGRVVDWFTTTAWPALQRFAGQVQEKFQGFIDWTKRTWPQVSEAIGHVLAVIRVIVGVFVVAALALWRTFGDTVLTFARNAWDAIWRVIQGVLTVIRGIIQTVLALINGDWSKAWEGITTILSGALGIMRGAVELGLAAVLGVLSLGLDAIQGVWNLVWAGMSAGLGAIWRGIKNGVVSGVNAVIGVINWFIRLLNHIPGVNISEIGEVGGGGGKPDVRTGNQEHGMRRARGGFMTNRGGRGGEYVVGEGNRFRPEAVIATDPRYRKRNLGLWAWAGQKLGVPGFDRGGVPGYALGGIPNPLNAVGDALSAGASFVRDISTRALGPVRDTAKAMINAIPGGERVQFLRDFGRSVVDRIYDWARGKTDEHEAAMSGSGGGSAKGLVGNAAAAFRQFREMFPNMTIGGWRARGSVPGSDHPKGKALDLMTGSNDTAQRIISTFMGQAGRKYWIWNRQIATQSGGWRPRSYHGPSPHTDHVHLSYYKRGGVLGFENGGRLPEDVMGVGPSGRRYRLHKGEEIRSNRDQGGGVTLLVQGDLVIQANDERGGRAAAKGFHNYLAERGIVNDARTA